MKQREEFVRETIDELAKTLNELERIGEVTSVRGPLEDETSDEDLDQLGRFSRCLHRFAESRRPSRVVRGCVKSTAHHVWQRR
jgi:hypothetical protein